MAEMTAARERLAAPLRHAEAMVLAATEFERIVALLEGLAPAGWQRPTICNPWDVRALASHVLGMAEAQASMRQFLHDFRAASKRSGGAMIDAMTATQVRERGDLTTAELVDRLTRAAPRAVRARRGTPRARAARRTACGSQGR